ncbi:MAG: alpha/beta hydrolase [Clostridiaceae bacterium]|nr:alpha/beta hydrolase [Clostridiaceae bacterium]
MHHNIKILFLSIFFTLVMFLLFFSKPITSYIYYSVYNKENLSINVSVVNTQIHTMSAESSNRLLLKASVKNSEGKPMKNAPIKILIEEGAGKLSLEKGATNELGECIFSYTPLNYYELGSSNSVPSTKITAQIRNSTKSSSISINLISTPIVMIYGFQESAEVYANLNEFLIENKYDCSIMEYDSKAGVEEGSRVLKNFLLQKKQDYINNGVLVNKFTLITHSMGGLVARYYTTSEEYLKHEDVNKIIFTAVPHRGSFIAALGQNFYKDKSIKDLSPDSVLFTSIFESSINKGLNSSIQVANITSQYDEVVTEESSSLEEWKIPTEMFNIGENSFTVDSILSGNILNAPNHKGILNNNKVFQKILEMLDSDLPYPNEIAN